MSIGRPSSFNSEKAEAILAALPFADGGLEEVCRAEGMPHASTVYRWLLATDGDVEKVAFREAYMRARELTGDVQAQRALDDALSAKDAGLGRLAFDARKWTASKLAPKRYGDKVQHVGGDEADAPIKHRVAIEFIRPADRSAS